MRKHSRVPVRRGFFVDVKTIGAALTSRSDSLASLAEFLKVPSRKLATEEHGGPLTPAYVQYAVQDTQVTWECYDELRRRYAQHGLTLTSMDRIKSEAGIGKAYLREMGIQPWRLMQPDFPPDIINIIMQTYYGGRSEVHLRRVLTQVLYCDFLSMYATVCTLMGLWRFVIAKGVNWRDSTEETRAFLASVTMRDLRKRKTWSKLRTLVQVIPDRDLFPVRGQYSGEAQYTIGLNYISSDTPIWYTLADCINAQIHTGKPVRIVRALSFEAKAIQSGLRPIDIAGNSEFRVNPRSGDFYKRLIELRGSIKQRLKISDPSERDALDSQQQTLKILASSTSYGIFVELNVEELNAAAAALRYSDDGTPCTISVDKAEIPGSYFSPLLATLITGAARLMLGIAEQLGSAANLDWAFCDTDSIAFAKAANMADSEFHDRAHKIRNWFNALNPYDGAGDLLKFEDVNSKIVNGKSTDEPAPLFVWAVSAKRYTLFNLGPKGTPILRKASAHGLGHLLSPYYDPDAPANVPAPSVPLREIGVDRWQYDFWYLIVSAAISDNPDRPNFSELPGFEKSAASRYAATTPQLLRWFNSFNSGREYPEQVGPFNFLTVFPARRQFAIDWEIPLEKSKTRKREFRDSDELPRPVAPYNPDPALAAANCFDRLTGKPVAIDRLKTYAEALSDYHLHPEAKFLSGDYLDIGPTERRHIHVIGVRYIGKEANRWEEQFYLGLDPEAQIEYDGGPESIAQIRTRIREATALFGQRRLAEAAGVSREQMRSIMSGRATVPRKKTVTRLLGAISDLTAAANLPAPPKRRLKYRSRSIGPLGSS